MKIGKVKLDSHNHWEIEIPGHKDFLGQPVVGDTIPVYPSDWSKCILGQEVEYEIYSHPLQPTKQYAKIKN